MAPEEDKVSLVVEGHRLSTKELGLLRKHRREHATHGVSQSGVEVVKNEFWWVTRWISVVWDVLRQHDVRKLKVRRWSLW